MVLLSKALDFLLFTIAPIIISVVAVGILLMLGYRLIKGMINISITIFYLFDEKMASLPGIGGRYKNFIDPFFNLFEE